LTDSTRKIITSLSYAKLYTVTECFMSEHTVSCVLCLASKFLTDTASELSAYNIQGYKIFD